MLKSFFVPLPRCLSQQARSHRNHCVTPGSKGKSTSFRFFFFFNKLPFSIRTPLSLGDYKIRLSETAHGTHDSFKGN